MTQLLREWFEQRVGDVPAPLQSRLRSIVDTAGEAETVDQQLRQLESAVASQLASVHERPCTVRRDALDLLTTDALISYSLEFAASLGPELLDEFADKLMRLAAGSVVYHVPGAT